MPRLYGEGKNEIIVMSARELLPRFADHWNRGENVPLDVNQVFQAARQEVLQARAAEQTQEPSGGMTM
jgi:hypothetical protein